MNRIQHFELKTQVAARFCAEQNCIIRVTSGRVWLTVEGHVGDTWLVAGGEHIVRRAALLWLSAEPSATISVVYPPVKLWVLATSLRALGWRLGASWRGWSRA